LELLRGIERAPREVAIAAVLTLSSRE